VLGIRGRHGDPVARRCQPLALVRREVAPVRRLVPHGGLLVALVGADEAFEGGGAAVGRLLLAVGACRLVGVPVVGMLVLVAVGRPLVAVRRSLVGIRAVLVALGALLV
jgi:hypothetical protein